MAEFRHCDDYIDDETQPECLRTFLDYARSPAHGAFHEGPKPKLFAKYKGQRVRVVMASRFGDVGITRSLKATHGYEKRVAVSDLSEFAAEAQAGVTRMGGDGEAGSGPEGTSTRSRSDAPNPDHQDTIP